VSWLGTLYAAIGTGAVGGALAGGWAGRRIGPARVFWLAMVLGGLLLLAYSRATDFPAALAAGSLVGLMFGALNAAAPPLLLAAIPQHLTGRVMSVFNPLQQIANIISMAAAGFLAGHRPARHAPGSRRGHVRPHQHDLRRQRAPRHQRRIGNDPPAVAGDRTMEATGSRPPLSRRS
jgi:MFS family permease